MKLTMLRRMTGGAALALMIWAFAGCSSEDKPTSPEKLDPVDEIAPLPPVGLTARQSANGFGAGWQANTEADLRGYHVYVLGADLTAADSWTRVTESPITSCGFSWKDASGQMEQFVLRVSAVDETGNESAWSSSVVAQTVSPPKGSVEIDPNAEDGSGGGSGGNADGGAHPDDPVIHNKR